MKSILSLVAVCAVVALGGCNNTKSNAVAPGAVGETKAGCCAGKAACTADKNGTSMGAVGDKASGCCKDAKNGAVSPGAVGDKAGCTKVCPMTGKTETVSPGAVGETKSGGCCSGKKS
jgi:hypothetical protein